MLWSRNRGKWKSRKSLEVEPRTPLSWAASAQMCYYSDSKRMLHLNSESDWTSCFFVPVFRSEKNNTDHNYTYIHHVLILLVIQQLWTVVLWLTQPMAKLVTLLEQHLGRLPPTVVIQAISYLKTLHAHAHVKLMECGLGLELPASVSQTCSECLTQSWFLAKFFFTLGASIAIVHCLYAIKLW